MKSTKVPALTSIKWSLYKQLLKIYVCDIYKSSGGNLKLLSCHWIIPGLYDYKIKELYIVCSDNFFPNQNCCGESGKESSCH